MLRLIESHLRFLYNRLFLKKTISFILNPFNVWFPSTLRQRLQSERSEEEARLREQSDRLLKELRESAQEEREKQQHALRSGQ